MAFVISTTLLYYFEEQFDQETWKSTPQQRYKMGDVIVEEKLFLGKSKNEIIEILGQPELNSESSDNVYLYQMGRPPSFFKTQAVQLVVTFMNDKVVNVSELYKDL